MILPHGRTLLVRLLAEAGRRMPGMYYAWLWRAGVGEGDREEAGMRWTKDENGERWPVYTEEEAQRIARAAWGVHFLLPHPDDAGQYAAALREFNNAMTCTPKRDNSRSTTGEGGE